MTGDVFCAWIDGTMTSAEEYRRSGLDTIAILEGGRSRPSEGRQAG